MTLTLKRKAVNVRGSAWSEMQLRSAGVLLTKAARHQLEVATETDEMAAAIAARDRLLRAIVLEDNYSVGCILRGLAKMRVDAEILKVTGLGHLLGDRQLWRSVSEFDGLFAQTLRQKWRTSQMGCNKANVERLKTASTMHGFKAVVFKGRVDAFIQWFGSWNESGTSTVHIRRLSLQLVLCGFNVPYDLVGLLGHEYEEITYMPITKALLGRAVLKMENAYNHMTTRTLTRALSNEGSAVQGAGRSARDMADHFTADMVKFIENKLTNEQWLVGITPAELGKPQKMIKALTNAKRSGIDVSEVLQTGAELLKLESVRASLPSVASGLRAWHGFAAVFLDYPVHQTLPPKSDEDVVEFVSFFKSSKTARNYISYVAWGCTFLGLSTEWRTKTVHMALDGSRKRELRIFGGAQRVEVLLNGSVIQGIVELADKCGVNDGFQELALLAWEFLLQVQSEGIPVEKGSAEEAKSTSLGHHDIPLCGPTSRKARCTFVWRDVSIVRVAVGW